MENICSSPFWDLRLTWYTDNPDFTPCFQDTILTWLPCALFILLLPYDLWKIATKNNGVIQWNFKNVTKLVSLCLLIIAELADLLNLFLNQGYSPKIDAKEISVIITIVIHVIILALMIKNRQKGVQCSFNIFIFWCLWILAELVRYRSTINGIDKNVNDYDVLRIALVLVKFPLVAAVFFVGIVNDGEPEPKYDMLGRKLTNEEENSSFASQLMIWWIVPLMRIGMSRSLLNSDVADVSSENRADFLGESLERLMLRKGKFSVYGGLFRLFGPRIGLVAFLTMVQELLVFLNPLLMSYLMDFANLKQELWKGVFYSVLLLVANVVKMFLLEHLVYKCALYAMQVKSALMVIVYNKSLRLSCTARQEWTSGEVVNMVSVDVQRVQEFLQFMFTIPSGVIGIVLSIYFLLEFLGLSSLAGLAVFIVLMPLNSVISKIISTLQDKLMDLKDVRVKMITEVLGGMKVLKLYAWEQPFEDIITRLRSKEVVALRNSLYTESTMISLFIILPFFVSLFTFVTYVYGYDLVLTPNVAFVSLALFNIIRTPMIDLPFVLGMFVKAYISMARVVSFMDSEEIEDDVIQHDSDQFEPIKIENGFFSWQRNGSSTLKKINFSVGRSKLVAVVGEIGSGKSSLISSVLGEMYKDNGTINVNGRLAYVPQQAWILHDTVENNILFKTPKNKKKYDDVIDKCALKSDFEILAAGDQTEIGEKGVNLSGGQKQRVSLARAVYNDADIYLFDDPLSAVDSHVGQHIFTNVIGPNGILNRKTRVLVTHGLKFLPECDYIYMMRNGEVMESGTYKALMADGAGFADLMNQYMEAKENEQEEPIQSDSELDTLSLSYSRELVYHQSSAIESRFGSVSSLPESMHPLSTIPETNEAGKLIDSEEMEEGNISWMVYFRYFKNIGPLYFSIMLIGFALNCAFDLAANEWLSAWSSDVLGYSDGLVPKSLLDTRVAVYTLYGILQAITFTGGMFMFNVGVVKCANAIHSAMLWSVMRAPMSFFDTTPLGRMLNRFSRDINTLDSTLQSEMTKLIYCIWKLVGAMVIISVNMPPFIVAAIFIMILYALSLVLSMRSLRQLMRLESVYRSPIYSHVQESISGVSSIRCYDVAERFMRRMYERIDSNQKFLFAYNVINIWLAILLQLYGAFIIFFTALVAVLIRDSLTPATVGLTINYAMTMTILLYIVVRTASIVEANVVSVERILEYTRIPQEAERHVVNDKLTSDWPSQGQIGFEEYETKYREGLDLVLKGISCNIKPSEKIGIVGRTGAGKSSLTLALFRIIESTGGNITIDGVDISTIGIHDLRKKLTIIPQDPVLFSGTFRMNVDPFDEYTDAEVWSSLEHAHLKKFVVEQTSGLDSIISEGGMNYSVGQRQLICLARALLRHTKILILDEATAAIDLETDDLIQQTIRKEFKDCTILTIAHRLNTIMDCDRVLVLSNGQIEESGSPSELLSNSHSVFYGMAVDAGLV